jgi:hypothetical protein
MSPVMDEYSGAVGTDAWLIPLFFAALLMWPTARAWFRVSQRRETKGDAIQLLAVDLRNAAQWTALTLGLVALSLLVWFAFYLF